jgi:hypothetical protein
MEGGGLEAGRTSGVRRRCPKVWGGGGCLCNPSESLCSLVIQWRFKALQ